MRGWERSVLNSTAAWRRTGSTTAESSTAPIGRHMCTHSLVSTMYYGVKVLAVAISSIAKNSVRFIVAQRSRPLGFAVTRIRTAARPLRSRSVRPAELPGTAVLAASPQPSPRPDRSQADHFCGSGQPHRSPFAARPLRSRSSSPPSVPTPSCHMP